MNDVPIEDLHGAAGLRARLEPEWLAASRIAETFLAFEAELLGGRDFHAWIGLLDEAVTYRVPVRVTAPEESAQFSDRMYHFDENLRTLQMRVERLDTGLAWAEKPPSRVRYVVSNVRAIPLNDDRMVVRSNLQVLRLRADDPRYEQLSGERLDVLGMADSEPRLCERTVFLDNSTLPTHNLALFL